MTSPVATGSTLFRPALDLGATALLLAVSVAGFWPTFGGPSYLVGLSLAVVLGLAIAAVGAWRRLGILVVTAITVLTYFVLGGALALPATTIAGVVPTLDTLAQLAAGAITSWKQLLTTVAPLSVADGHLLPPFLLLLVASVVTGSLALRLRTPAWAVIPAALALIVQIAIGTSQPAVPLIQGVVFAVIAIVWLAVRQALLPTQQAIALGDQTGASASTLPRRLLAGAGVVALAIGAGVAVSAFASPPTNRYVLRDVVIPPLDLRQYPSPLQSFRAHVRDDADATLFTVSGLPEGARVRLATMDAYDGTVYNVSDDGAGTSSAFTPIRANMSPGATGTPATLRVEIDELDTVWLPDAGATSQITFEGDRADDLRRSTYFNDATGTAVVTQGLQAGDAYALQTTIPVQPSDEGLAGRAFGVQTLPDQEAVPQEFADVASQAVADATTPIEQVRALQEMLATEGFFSHGLEGQALSRAGHGAERISTLLGSEQMVGDDEQYAVAMTLLARELGIPARVVMGFYPDEDTAGQGVFTATGDTLHAWVEVSFEGAGWVAFDPTPPEDQIPNDQTTKPRADPKPQVLQPPPPEQDPVDLPATVPDDREAEEDEPIDLSLLGLILTIVLGSLLLLAILAAPFVAIAVLKLRRRRRRRSAGRPVDRISGGWDELVDRATDLGAVVPAGATRAEDAAIVATSLAQPDAAATAARADVRVFGPGEPTDADVEAFWLEVDGIVGRATASRSLWARWCARFSLRSLVARTRISRFLPSPRTPRPPASETPPKETP